ncbi:MAG: hypothetical protein ACK5BL_08415 [Flavobacteriales bacterium]
MRKALFILICGMLCSTASFSQYKGLVTEQVENEGKVPGRTWRIYAQMTNVGDQLFVVFGDSAHKIEIKSSKPFYQAKTGGALSKDSNRKEASEDPSLKFDSWVTIGAEDNYNNNINTLNLDLSLFESRGGAIDSGKEGAWFCIPTDKQAYAGEDKRILLMQLTSAGTISGKLSLMGKSKDGESYTKYDQTFQCGKK